MTPLIDVHDVGRHGGKALGLARLLSHGFRVPAGFALDIDEARAWCDADDATPLVEAARALSPLVAVRSSALGEDDERASHAGLYASRIGVRARDVVEALRDVVASAEMPDAQRYRARLGHHAQTRLAVVVQRAVRARVSGVLFTAHPTTGRDELVVEAALGLGELVVAGHVTPDHLRLTPRGDVREVRIGDQETALVLDDDGPREVALGAEARACAVDDELREALVALAARAERALGRALDIEWAHDGENLFVLQCRPMTARGAAGPLAPMPF